MTEDQKTFDVIILGGGPAGLAAAIYAARARLTTLLVEKAYPGGQLMMCESVENYPGFVNSSSGYELSSAMREQAEKFGMETRHADVEKVELAGDIKILHTASGEEIRGQTVILSLGARPRRLGIPGESEFHGRGVSYCAVCDGAFFQGKKLAVIGGGDTAVEDSVYLTHFATSVTIVHRRDKFRAQRIIQERALSNPVIKVSWDSVVKTIGGQDSVEHVILENVHTKQTSMVEVDGVFVLIGLDPNTKMLDGQVTLDEMGYIITDEEMRTNIPGVFAAGDVRQKVLRQIITACADGAIAATSAEKYLETRA
ncbi:MAG: thioredoxin-disulfide reductase [Armatimonadetes bacterium]|nr:thioredoxin-disulfide reductase [Armatimonadota bacterium]